MELKVRIGFVCVKIVTSEKPFGIKEISFSFYDTWGIY
jgi:hypothetical protein